MIRTTMIAMPIQVHNDIVDLLNPDVRKVLEDIISYYSSFVLWRID